MGGRPGPSRPRTPASRRRSRRRSRCSRRTTRGARARRARRRRDYRGIRRRRLRGHARPGRLYRVREALCPPNRAAVHTRWTKLVEKPVDIVAVARRNATGHFRPRELPKTRLFGGPGWLLLAAMERMFDNL